MGGSTAAEGAVQRFKSRHGQIKARRSELCIRNRQILSMNRRSVGKFVEQNCREAKR